MRRARTTLAAALLALAAGAQETPPAEAEPPEQEIPEEEGTEPQDLGVQAVELRVVTSGVGDEVEIDRGSNDGLELGDLVLFYVEGGRTVGGSVSEVSARTARVRLEDPRSKPTVGARGRVYVPRARLARTGGRPAPAPDPETPPWLVEAERSKPVVPAPVPVEEGDLDGFEQPPAWTPDMPLLAGIEPVHPRERTRFLGGRLTYTLDGIATDTDRTDLWTRGAADVWVENPFGRGGSLNLDLEGNFRSTVNPDGQNENRTRLRLDRLSYAWGGNRFDGERYQVGRFLQEGMPEFGVVDGGEYSLRMKNGDRFGASAGFMPEPDLDHRTGQDFQVSAFYHWMLDDSERMALETGVQKTWHDGDSDRDLLVTRFRYFPLEGWRTNATLWLDRYGASDPGRGAGLGITQLIASATRNYGLDSGHGWTYHHRELPDLDRNEYLPVLADELKNDRLDRLTYDAWKRLDRGRRLHARISGWLDENDEGGTAEAGVEWQDVLYEGLRADLTLFGGQSAYGFDLGADLSCFWVTERGRWESGYDITRRQQDDFDADRNTLFLHRVYLRHHWAYGSRWNLSTYVEGRLAEEELSGQAGLTLQRTF